MDFGLQIPTTIPGVTGERLLDWARFIDDGPFASLGAPDRFVYDNLEPMTALAAAAAVTERVRITTTCVIPALRGPVAFAKQAATLATLAPGRLALGLIIGARANDFEAVGLPFDDRGRLLDEALEVLRAQEDAPDAQRIGPDVGHLELLIGGGSPPAIRRLVRHADGYVSGGIKPEFFGYEARAIEAAWDAAGREGRPRLVAGTWFTSSLDPDDEAAAHHAEYFTIGGPPDFVSIGLVRGRDGVLETIEAFADEGADEVVFWPMTDDLAEAEWLADVVAGH